MAETGEWIRVRGARVHNLRNVDVDIPHNQLTVLTGPSGSGKSSLAFDTLHAEGQRRYLETLPIDPRVMPGQLRRPDVDSVEGLPPTLCISQQGSAARLRSTLGTVTEIYDYLRLLWARVGVPHCHTCGKAIVRHRVAEVVREVLGWEEGSKVVILAPLAEGEKGANEEALQRIRKAGFVRARIDGAMVEVQDLQGLNPRQAHTVEMVVDRLVVRPTAEDRLRESVETAVQFGGGSVTVVRLAGGAQQDHAYHTRYGCPKCGVQYSDLEPRHFSFNSPYGACPACHGLGRREQIDAGRLAPDPGWSLTEVLSLLEGLTGGLPDLPVITKAALKKLARPLGLAAKDVPSPDVPLRQWPGPLADAVLHGKDETRAVFPGLVPWLQEVVERAGREEDAEEDAEVLRPLLNLLPCRECGGARLNREARSVLVAGQGIHEVAALTVADALPFFRGLAGAAPAGAAEGQVRAMLVPEVVHRLEFLDEIGLGYLTLDRPATTLSGGEWQRARLATHLGGSLVGVGYVLDEPTIGLHPRDTHRLIAALRRLQGQGNTVVVVEHDEAVIRHADYLIEIGPGAGPGGGRVTAMGAAADTLGRVLPTEPPPRRRARPCAGGPEIRIVGASHRNLKDVDVGFPLGRLVCVTGVSGSGKTSLVYEVLCRAVRQALGLSTPPPGRHRAARGLEHVDKIIEVDQAPIGRSPRSTPATFTGVYEEIRQLFAGTREAKAKGYSAARFGINSKGGRCEECKGLGVRKVAMQLLPDLTAVCPACDGRRFDAATLEVKYKGRSIGDVLALPIAAALELFANVPKVAPTLQALTDIGLGYVTLGQPATTLSGGEAQRIKLATELARRTTGRTLLVLDEPTTGLHFSDVWRLEGILQRLVDAGNTAVVIEHNLPLIASADWVIDLGPDAGARGGEVVAAGPPDVVAATPGSVTGQYLRGL